MGTSETAVRKRLSRTRQELKVGLLKEEKDINEMIAMDAICAFLSTPSIWAEPFRDYKEQTLEYPINTGEKAKERYTNDTAVELGGKPDPLLLSLSVRRSIYWNCNMA